MLLRINDAIKRFSIGIDLKYDGHSNLKDLSEEPLHNRCCFSSLRLMVKAKQVFAAGIPGCLFFGNDAGRKVKHIFKQTFRISICFFKIKYIFFHTVSFHSFIWKRWTGKKNKRKLIFSELGSINVFIEIFCDILYRFQEYYLCDSGTYITDTYYYWYVFLRLIVKSRQYIISLLLIDIIKVLFN